MKSNSNDATPIKQGSNESSNNDDMGSTTKNIFTNRSAPTKEKVSSPSAVNYNQHSSAFHPVQHWPATTAPVGNTQTMGSTGVTGAPSLTMVSVPVEGQAANYSLNGSNSGSNQGSNGQNGGSTTANAGGVNVESANIMAEKSGAMNYNGNGSGSGSGSAVYQNWLTREAALIKFRQKRKERNFNKRVDRFQLLNILLPFTCFTKCCCKSTKKLLKCASSNL